MWRDWDPERDCPCDACMAIAEANDGMIKVED